MFINLKYNISAMSKLIKIKVPISTKKFYFRLCEVFYSPVSGTILN